MTYWVGINRKTKTKYTREFKRGALFDHYFNPFKTQKCQTCDQIVIMKLIEDNLSNSSGLIYAGKCVNGHWNQTMPTTPFDVRKIPTCETCNSYMQYKMSKEYNGWICPNGSREDGRHFQGLEV